MRAGRPYPGGRLSQSQPEWMDPSPQVLGIEVLLRFKVRLKAQLKVIPVYVPSRAPMLWLSALVATKVIIKTAILITSYWKAYGKSTVR